MAVDIELVYRRYGPMVLRRCRRLLGDQDTAVDVMHDVFVKLLDRGDRLQDRGLSSLLYIMATHESLNRLRSARRAPLNLDRAALLEVAALDDAAECSLVRSLLDRVFEREAPSTRVIAVLRHVDGLTWEEVAEVSGLSVSGARKRLRHLSVRAAKLLETV